MLDQFAGGARRLSLALFAGSIGFTACAWSNASENDADVLLAIDQHRGSVIERVVTTWGGSLAQSSAHVSVDELRARLEGLRADRLLAASLAGTLDGLREVIGDAVPMNAIGKLPPRQLKSLGDSAVDHVYTPVTPCRLVDTRGTFDAVYQGNGTVAHTPVPFTPNEIRSYTLQGANGECLSQLPAGLQPSAVQLQVFGLPTTAASGDIEILPQGAVFGSTATMVYVGSIAFNTVSTAAKVNLANNHISVQVRGGGAHVAIDVVGYFKRPGNYVGTHVITGLAATDSGGSDNSASGNYGTVAGGRFNVASGTNSSVGGGSFNTASASDTLIGGGSLNTASGNAATVGGGILNTASNFGATVSGGEFNSANGTRATVSGGTANGANGAYSTVSGGLANSATGDHATVAGGIGNQAGIRSFAAGTSANAANEGCFVWADATSENAASCPQNNAFVSRSLGGFYFFTGGSSDATYTGAQLPPGAGAWSVYSDRASKDNIAVTNPGEVLDKLMSVPIATWNWTAQGEGIRHMGPIAQDFRAAFGLGESDRSISTVDADGVALAAIQGLNTRLGQRISEQQREIERLNGRLAEIAMLREEIASLRTFLNGLPVTAVSSPAATTSSR